MSTTASFSGGCACGATRYECSAEPVFAVSYHCRDCQRATSNDETGKSGASSESQRASSV